MKYKQRASLGLFILYTALFVTNDGGDRVFWGVLAIVFLVLWLFAEET